ncbi:MAG TPA: hypothetical protein VKA54_17850 [Gemmatimonadaceae bacterium]|nr:hypothetical protein [Gemmatimonadaceae bacterium]
MSPLTNAPRDRTVRRALLVALLALSSLVVAARGVAGAQTVSSSGGDVTSAGNASALHMMMTPVRAPAPGDSARAARIAAELRHAILEYRDTTAAVADGYRMFAPQIKNQKVYHFTRGWSAVQEAFRFDPAKPTSLLYTKGADGRFVLVGGMYTAPKRFDLGKLDERIPLSIARWHKHVNWCVPGRGQTARWLERANGRPVFGPESPIATRKACDAVGGVFYESPLGWMVHANVMTSSDPKMIWGDEHAGHDMHDGMKGDMHDGMKHDRE